MSADDGLRRPQDDLAWQRQQMDRFHAHLDGCDQCREHPLNLCVIGAYLLQATALRRPYSGLSVTTS